jgi:hypothetical protein
MISVKRFCDCFMVQSGLNLKYDFGVIFNLKILVKKSQKLSIAVNSIDVVIAVKSSESED